MYNIECYIYVVVNLLINWKWIWMNINFIKKVNNIDKFEIYIIKNKVSQSYILFLLIFK